MGDAGYVVIQFGGIWGFPSIISISKVYGWQGVIMPAPSSVIGEQNRGGHTLLVEWWWQGTVVPFNLAITRDYVIPSTCVMWHGATYPSIIGQL